MTAAEIASVCVIESRACVRTACGAVFRLAPDDPDQETCSRYCSSLLRMERSKQGKGTTAKAPALMPGSDLIGDPPTPPAIVEVAQQARPSARPKPPETMPALSGQAANGHPATVAQMTAPRPRIELGPSHRDYDKPERTAPKPTKPPHQPWQETRVCEADGCSNTFVATSDSKHRRFHSNTCAAKSRWAGRRATGTAIRTRIAAVVQPVAMVEAAPVVVAEAAPADPLRTCPCLFHADQRREQGVAPLPIRIGGLTLPSAVLRGARP